MAMGSWHLRSPLSRRGSGDPAEHGAGHQSGAAGIVEIEQVADKFAGRVQAGNDVAVAVDDAGFGVDLEAAEGEGDAAGHGIGLERRLVDGVRPVRFWNWQANRAAAILDVGIEGNVTPYRGV